jgi:carboxymethylenebutenolidase
MAGRLVEFPINGSITTAYLSTPPSGEGLGVLVLQEWWGLVGHIKAVCDRFAGAGFSALAPDLYHGKTASEPDEAGKLFMALSIPQVERDLRGATRYLLQHASGPRVGAVGFCMGGQLALFAATLDPSIGATVNFYGIHPNVKPDYRRLSGPVLGLYAEKDAFVTPEAARAVDQAIRAAGKQSEVHIYPGVDHAFFNDERPDVYDREAAADAWQRTLGFLRRHLATTPT